MIERPAVRLPLLLVLAGNLVLPLGFAEPVVPSVPIDTSASHHGSNDTLLKPFTPVQPGPVDGRVAFVAALMLRQYHFSQQRFDTSVSIKFFDHYLDAWDSQHMHFTQGDLDEFAHYRTNLDHLTLTGRGVGDTRPACEIYNRFVERLQQHVAYVDEVLKTEKFTFDTDERVLNNRHEAPYPKDLDEAKRLWRERLRLEYLQEHLGKIDAKKKSESVKTPSGKNTEPAVEKTPATPPKTEAEEIVETLTHRYHRTLRTYTDLNDDDVLQAYLNTLAHVYDPHSDFLGRPQVDSFDIQMNLRLFGIGAELTSEDGYCTIRRLLPGGPAIKSHKINEKDRIIAVAQGDQPPVDVVDMSLNKAVQLIRGPKGTEVRLTIIPASDSSSRSVISLIRDEIPLEDQAAKAKIIDLADGSETTRVGVIDLPSFYAPFDLSGGRRPELATSFGGGGSKSTSADVAHLLTKLKQENVKGIVLDLRRNGGGSLEEAVKLTGLFIKDGPVVQVKTTGGKIDEDDDTDPAVLYDGPLIVLTSRFSASASEIVAGALQDYGRALVVGDSSTHGKGTVQMVSPLGPNMQIPDLTNDPGALKVTIKKFYRPSGASTQLKGVVPDIVLPSVWNEAKDVGEASLENPLPYDTIASSRYDPVNMVTPYLGDLKRRSNVRVGADKEYAYVREDIELYKKQQADKTISLNENVRLKEREESEARQKARDKERLSRKAPADKVYELTLKLAAQPGLPPAVGSTNAASAKTNAAVKPGAATPGKVNPMTMAEKASSPDDDSEEKPAPVDATLNETEHILVDYLAALSKDHLVTAGH